MAHYLLVVHSEYLEGEGKEKEFNDWYGNHIDNLRKVEGVRSVQRSRLLDIPSPTREGLRYLAIYDIETDDVVAFQKSVIEAESGTPRSSAFNYETSRVGFFEVLDD